MWHDLDGSWRSDPEYTCLMLYRSICPIEKPNEASHVL
jgi:hypothetical protein